MNTKNARSVSPQRDVHVHTHARTHTGEGSRAGEAIAPLLWRTGGGGEDGVTCGCFSKQNLLRNPLEMSGW